MTYDEAMKAVDSGKEVRHPGMGKGWVIVRKDGVRYHREPVTGSHVQLSISDTEKASPEWRVVAKW